MTRRVVIGQRADGTFGIFVSPPGVDAYTASDPDLLLNVSSRIPSVLQVGAIYSTQSVYLGLAVRPHVYIWGTGNSLGELPGYESVRGGVTRPAPLFADDPASDVDIAFDGSSMTVNCTARTIYAVYNYQL